MPLTRYQIRNEYSLADQELYRAADRDDPEALLEGVAMAGLVGILRQLGDLAEFAAGIFHDLHEEVMVTASRGHGLMARVKQLEAEFPSIERAFLTQTSHSVFFNNTCVDWHPNLHVSQNLITSVDLPRFVMDSYEDCRGPPRLFLLDKFDIAGAGACLKRYTDPSFFKSNEASSQVRTPETQREKKARKVKKKGSRWRNRGTPEVTPTSHAKLHQLFLEERIEIGHSYPSHRVKLKKRLLNGSPFDSKARRSYMEKFLDTSSPESKVHEISVTLMPQQSELTSKDIRETGLEIVDIGMVSPSKESLQKDRSAYFSPEELGAVINGGLVSLPSPTFISEVEDEKELAVDGEIKGERTLEGYHSDDITSEVENYVDALATMESEMETDNESKPRQNMNFPSTNKQELYSDTNEERQEILGLFSDAQSTGLSTASDDGNSSFNRRTSNSSFSDTVGNLAENPSSDVDEAMKPFPHELGEVSCTSFLTESNSMPLQSDPGVSVRELGEISSECMKADDLTSNSGESWRSQDDDLHCTADVVGFEKKNSWNEIVESVGKEHALSVSENHLNEESLLANPCGPDTVNRISSEVDPGVIHGEVNNLEGVSRPTVEERGESNSDHSVSTMGMDVNGNVQSDEIVTEIAQELVSVAIISEANISVQIEAETLHDGASDVSQPEMGFAETDLPPYSGEKINTEDFSSTRDCEERSGSNFNPNLATERINDDKVDLDAHISISEAGGTIASKSETPDNMADDVLPAGLGLAEEGSGNGKKFEGFSSTKDHEERSESNEDSEGATEGICDNDNVHLYERVADTVEIKSVASVSAGTGYGGDDDGEAHDNDRIDLSRDDITLQEEQLSRSDFVYQCGSTLSEGLSPRKEIAELDVVPADLDAVTSNEQSSSELLDSFLHVSSVTDKPESDFHPSDATTSPAHSNQYFSQQEAAHLSNQLEKTKDILPSSPMDCLLELRIQPEQSSQLDTEGLAANEANFRSSDPQNSAGMDPLKLVFPGFGFLPEVRIPVVVEEMPPLPPLPPVQWMRGKHQPDSHAFSSTFDEKSHSGFPPLHEEITATLHVNPFLSISSAGNDLANNNLVQPSPPFTFMNPFLALPGPSLPKDSHQGNGEISQEMKGPFSPVQSVEDNTSSFIHPFNNSVHKLSLEPTIVHSEGKMERNFHSDIFMQSPTSEDEQSWHNWQTSEGENSYATEDGNPDGNLPKHPRPRDPLIEAVAAHDKTTLRKVAERVRPRVQEKVDERDSLLEQIRTKSFNLKPAVVTRPSIQGPKTNLKVAAILEKANAIRQALAGSDEDDDADSWSDS